MIKAHVTKVVVGDIGFREWTWRRCALRRRKPILWMALSYARRPPQVPSGEGTTMARPPLWLHELKMILRRAHRSGGRGCRITTGGTGPSVATRQPVVKPVNRATGEGVAPASAGWGSLGEVSGRRTPIPEEPLRLGQVNEVSRTRLWAYGRAHAPSPWQTTGSGVLRLHIDRSHPGKYSTPRGEHTLNEPLPNLPIAKELRRWTSSPRAGRSRRCG